MTTSWNMYYLANSWIRLLCGITIFLLSGLAMADEEAIPPTQARPDEEEHPEDDHPEAEKSEPEDKEDSKSPFKRPATAAKSKAVAKTKAKAKAKAKVAPSSGSSPKKVKPTIHKRPSANITKGGSKGNKGGSKGSKADQEEVPLTPMKAKKTPDTPEAPKKRPAADGQPKAKTKAKAKAKALFEKMPADKDPDSEQGDDDKEEGEEEEEEKEFEEDKEIDDFEDSAKTTDRCKKQKFMQMLSSGQVPAHVANMWKESTTMKTGRLDRQRLIINSLFDRSAAGRLIMNTNKPVFTSEQKTFSEYSNTKRHKSLTKVLFCGKFNLSEDAFQQGLANNEFQEIVEDGVVKYTWDANVESTAAGSRSETGAKASVEGKVGDAKKFLQLGTSSMAKGLGPPMQQSAKMPMGNKALAPIMDQQTPATKELTAEQWNFAQGQLHPSMAAMDKLEKEGLKMVQLVGQDNKQDPLFVKLSLGCI